MTGGNFVLNLRYPGQRYDSATGLNYNYFRDYDAGSGRYVESDPVGLWNDISVYRYALNNPHYYFDSLGLGLEARINAWNRASRDRSTGIDGKDGADSIFPVNRPPQLINCVKMKCCTRQSSNMCMANEYCFNQGFIGGNPSPPEVDSGKYDTNDYQCKCSAARINYPRTEADQAGPEDLLDLIMNKLRSQW
jgi:RHS repeat-associated protein